MAKFLSIVLSVFLLSACATVTEDNDSLVAGTQALSTSVPKYNRSNRAHQRR